MPNATDHRMKLLLANTEGLEACEIIKKWGLRVNDNERHVQSYVERSQPREN